MWNGFKNHDKQAQQCAFAPKDVTWVIIFLDDCTKITTDKTFSNHRILADNNTKKKSNLITNENMWQIVKIVIVL